MTRRPAHPTLSPHPPLFQPTRAPPLATREPSPHRDRYGAGKTKVTILGAGHGGTAMAGHLSLMGFDVSLYNRSPERLRAIQAAGGLEILSDYTESLPRGFAPLETVTADPAEAIRG